MSKEADQTVKVERHDAIACIILNRFEKRNATTPALHREMVEILTNCVPDFLAAKRAEPRFVDHGGRGNTIAKLFDAVSFSPEPRPAGGHFERKRVARRLTNDIATAATLR